MSIIKPCGICGGLVRSNIPSNLHPRTKAALVESDMQAHLRTHSFAELLRFEIRQDLEEVPEDQRPVIVRDIYRSLLGTTTGTCFTLGETDGSVKGPRRSPVAPAQKDRAIDFGVVVHAPTTLAFCVLLAARIAGAVSDGSQPIQPYVAPNA